MLFCVVNNICVAEKNNLTPMVTNCPPLYNPYTVNCDLNYANEPVYLIFEKIKQDNIPSICPVSISVKTMDMLVFLESDENELAQALIELRKDSDFFFAIEGIEGQKERCIGLVGKQDTLSNVLEAIKAKHTVNRVVKGLGLRIDLVGSGVPFWKVIGQIAQKSLLGLEYQSGDINLVPNYRTVLAYESKEPFFLYFSKDMASGKLVLDVLYNPNSIEIKSIDSINIKEVILRHDYGEKRISGHKVVFEQNMTRGSWVEWISDEPVELKTKLTVMTVIESFILTDRYCIDNLHDGSLLKNDNLSVNVGKYAALTTAPVSLNPGKEKATGDWMCIEIQTDNKSSLDEAEQQDSEKLPMITVPSIGKRIPDSKIQSDARQGFNSPMYNLCDGRRIYEMETRGNRTYICFDSIQNGSDIFPMGIELWKYQPAHMEFTFSWVEN